MRGAAMPAILDKPILPPYLYRYRKITDKTINQEIAAITQKYLWFSTYKEMNDPMEGFFEPTRPFQKDSNYARTAQSIYFEKIKIGICCFSDTYDNELMWSHYADNYSGICVGYAPQRLIDGLPQDAHLVRVAYGLKPPDVNWKDSVEPSKAAIKVLSHKKASWLYEREWRVLGPLGRVNITSKICLREVRIGMNMKHHFKTTLLAALSGHAVRVDEMEKVSDYSHKWSKVRNSKGEPV
jgi:hypothetical protein